MAVPEIRVHPTYIRSEKLGREITELCSYIYAAKFQLLVKIHEFDRDGLWKLAGICSCAHWLNFKCGIGMNAARENVRVANALPELPKISESFARGELSYSKVRAMTRVATPENEDSLLNIAHHGSASHVESLCSKYRKARRLHERPAADRQYRDRGLRYRYDDDGALILNGRFPGEQGALILKALQQAMERMEAEDTEAEVAAESRQSLSVRRADALSEMAESYLADGPGHSSSAERYQVLLHVSAETLKDSAVEISHIEDGPHVSAETSRRICCDSSISPIMTDDMGEPLGIGRKSRVIPPSMRRALRARDDGCRFPGCTHRHFVDGHHIEHWADGGETSLTNLVLLCRHHHRLVHEGGFGCERTAEGELRFRGLDGRQIDHCCAQPAVTDNPLTQRRIKSRLEALHIDATTCVPHWRAGESMDYAMAVDGLWSRDHAI